MSKAVLVLMFNLFYNIFDNLYSTVFDRVNEYNRISTQFCVDTRSYALIRVDISAKLIGKVSSTRHW